jgi:hypothetical protein
MVLLQTKKKVIMKVVQALTFQLLVAILNASMIMSIPLSLRADTSEPIAPRASTPVVTTSPVAINAALGLPNGENITSATGQH